MESIRSQLDKEGIHISPVYYGTDNYSTTWELNIILERKDAIKNALEQNPVTAINNVDEYISFHISQKLMKLEEIIPKLSQEEGKTHLTEICEAAKSAISAVGTGNVIRFINSNIQDIFESTCSSHDVRAITLELIAKYCDGIKKKTFDYLCKNYKHLLIEHFDQFERTLERHPDLFECLFSTGHYEEISPFQLSETLAIWCHVLNKGTSNLKGTVERCIGVITEDIQALAENATIENIIQVEEPVRIFSLFLHQIHSPKAIEFLKYARSSSELLSRRVIERGHSFPFEIPAGEIVCKWKKEPAWMIRLFSLTHSSLEEGATHTFVSHLSMEPREKHPLIDMARTNIPTDDYFTMSHQQDLEIQMCVSTGTIIEILLQRDTMVDYLSQVNSAISYIENAFGGEGDHFREDMQMLSTMVQLVVNNQKNEEATSHALCYGATMFICAFAEKILRTLYMHLVRNEPYVPTYKATLGELLSASNPQISAVFGENHIRNLSFFFQQDSSTRVGRNIRNNLAHWVNISASDLTIQHLGATLWLFTDILNTVFWYCLHNSAETQNNDKHS